MFRYFPAKREKGERRGLCTCDHSESRATAEWSQHGDLVITLSFSPFSSNYITLFFAKKSGIVLVEMADRAGSGSSEFHIEL